MACADGHDVCLRLSTEPRDDTRWDPATRRLEQEADRLPAGANALSDGSNVYIVSSQVDGYAAATAIGRVGATAWRTPATKVAKTQKWLMADKDGFVDVGTGVAVVELTRRIPLGAQRRFDGGELVLLDQSKRATVGIDLTDGHVLWRQEGADFTCLELSRTSIPVRCAFEGSLAYRSSWTEPRPRDARASVEGFDPQTGRTTWSYELDGRASATLLVGANEPNAGIDLFADSSELAAVASPSGGTLLSLIDGSHRELTRASSLLCRLKVRTAYTLDETDFLGDVPTPQRWRMVRRSCAVNGKDSRGRLGAEALLTGAEDAGSGIWAFAGARSIEAYRVS